MGQHHPPPAGSADLNIRHRVTVFDPMPATSGAYQAYNPCLSLCEGRVATELHHTKSYEATQLSYHGPARL